MIIIKVTQKPMETVQPENKKAAQEEEKKEEGKEVVPAPKKKLGLLKKKNKTNTWNKIYSNVDIKQVVNINDLVFINENALKDPENSESLLSAIFYYKMISKVAIGEHNISITLKKLDENAFPPEYYLDRLRSYGDTRYKNIADYLGSLRESFAEIEDPDKTQEYVRYKLENFALEEEAKKLNQHLDKRKGKKYLVFFSEVCPAGVMLKKIVISTPLLLELGFNINEIALDFIKHKHIFFEIFTAKMYATMMESALGKFSDMTSALMEKEVPPEQIEEKTTITYNDEMIRKRTINGNIQEELLSVRVKWFSPHPSIGIFEIDNVQQKEEPYSMGMKRIKKYELPDIQDELKSLSHLTKIDPSLLAENKNRCCTFKMISQADAQPGLTLESPNPKE